MAQKGTYSAYTRLTPVRTDFGALSDKQFGQYDQYRREEEYKDQVQEQQNIAMARQAADDMASLSDVVTGIHSVDQINHLAVGMAREKLGEFHRMQKENPALLSDVDHQLRIANLKKLPQMIAQAQGKMADYAAKLTAGLQDGTLSDANADTLAEIEALFGFAGEDGKISPNYIIDVSENGTPTVRGITKDGREFESSLLDMVSGVRYGELIERADVDKYIKAKQGTLGKRVKAFTSNGMRGSAQKFDYIESEARASLEADLGTADNPSNLARSIWVDEMGNSPGTLDENAMDQIKDGIIERLRVGYDETSSLSGRATAAKETAPEPARQISLMQDTSGGGPMTFTRGGRKAFGFSLPEPVSSGVGDKSRRVNQVYSDAFGNIYMEGEQIKEVVQKNRSIDQTVPYTVNSKDNPEKVEALARQMGFRNARELSEYLEKLKPETFGSQALPGAPDVPLGTSGFFGNPEASSGLNWK